MHRSSSFVVLASFLAAAASGLTQNNPVTASKPGAAPAQTVRVSVRADVNGLFVTVRSDGTLAPASGIVGIGEQFDVHDLGKGLIALRSAANGRFVSARNLQPLAAKGTEIGEAEMFRSVGGPGGLVRLRSVAAKGFVCADQAGQAALAVTKHCPHEWQLLLVEPVQSAPPSFTITTPVPGSVLRATTVTFQWDQSGDDSWLKVGTTPGGSEIYASGPLGTATEHTVPGLPLNGARVYVQVSRRVGALIESVTVEYTAAIRKGLAIITDFADRRLEDWAGPGITNVNDLSLQLQRMEEHWGWLSRGLETFAWDIIRVELPQRAVANAYQDWVAFREAVVTLARQQVQTADYDVDGDGVIDAAWLIVSSGDESVPFAIGGTSRNAGANVFVDGQASGSVQAGATGNFNHELGHCLGLPDMYGPFTTVNKLTVMADSWALPPSDFSAYERIKLGWVKPQTITQTTRAVWLPSAHENLAAVMVPTVRPAEYFLIEYRSPPSSGFGSAVQGYRGLAVYHVLDGSSMWEDPPIVRLEPADGSNVPNQELDPHDFVYPENPALLRPLTLRSYYNDRDPVLTISNVVWRDNGLAFDVTIVPQPPPLPGANMLVNGSFETGGSGQPEGWSAGSWVPQDATFVWPSAIALSGDSSAYLESVHGNDMRWTQSVATLVVGERYMLCGALKGEDIQSIQAYVGANVSVMGGFVRSESAAGTFEWTRMCVTFRAETPQVDVACRLGFFGSTAAGKLWCDDFTLEHVRLHGVFEP